MVSLFLHSTQVALWLGLWKEHHLLQWLHDSGLCWTFLCWSRDCLVGCHGLAAMWPSVSPCTTWLSWASLCVRSWTGTAGALGFLHGGIQIVFMVQLPFCGPNVIDHFYAAQFNTSPELACLNTHTLGPLISANSGSLCLLTFLMLVASYVVILRSWGLRALKGRRKALSTCASHVTVCHLVLCALFVPLPETHGLLSHWQSLWLCFAP